MSFTVRQALELDILRQADAVVMAGADRLDTPIRWVHISEQPDVAGYLKGGELLFTTGMGLGHNTGLQRRYIRELSEVGVAGLLVRLGGTFKTMPPSLVTEAEARHLPLIALRRRIANIVLTEQVHAAIISRQFELIKKAESIGQDFTQLVTQGADLQVILHRLAAIVENPVILEDPAHQLIEYATHAKQPDEVLAAWDAHSRQGHEEAEEGRVHFVPGSPNCLWASILLKGERLGRVHALEVDTRLDDMDRLALDRAAAAVALTLIGSAEAAHLTDRACRVLMSDILVGRQGAPKDFFRRASSCRADFQGKHLFALVVLPHGLAAMAAEEEMTETERRRIRHNLVTEVRAALGAGGRTGLCAEDGDRVLVILGLESPTETRERLDALGEAVCARLMDHVGDFSTVVGVSNEAAPQSLRRALEEASEAASYGRGRTRGPRVFHFDDLGLDHLLLQLSKGPELARYVESELSPVLRYDAGGRSPLLATLRAYLDHGGRKTEAALALSIERRTLYHRLERLNAVLERDIEDQETRFRLWLALKALDLLRQRSPQGVGARLPLTDDSVEARPGRVKPAK